MRASATGRVLNDPKGGSFRFDAGAVCLDFAHTGGEGPYAVFETLHEPADLAEWLAQPPLAAVMTVPVTARELAAAKALRQAIWDAAHARAARRPLPTEAVATINRAAAAAPLVPELAADGTTAGWAPPVRATQALSTLAREMIELLSGPLVRAHPRVRERQLPAGVRRLVPPRRPALVRDGALRQPPQAPGSPRPAGHGPVTQPRLRTRR